MPKNGSRKNKSLYICPSVFIDKTGFNLHTVRNVTWFKIDKNTNVTISIKEGEALSFPGADCLRGAISMSVRLLNHYKKRKTNKRNCGGKITNSKVDNSSKPEAKGRGGTNSKHLYGSISGFMNALDRNDIKQFNLVMNNASIHSSEELK